MLYCLQILTAAKLLPTRSRIDKPSFHAKGHAQYKCVFIRPAHNIRYRYAMRIDIVLAVRMPAPPPDLCTLCKLHSNPVIYKPDRPMATTISEAAAPAASPSGGSKKRKALKAEEDDETIIRELVREM